MYVHTTSCTLPTCDISLGSLTLPAPEAAYSEITPAITFYNHNLSGTVHSVHALIKILTINWRTAYSVQNKISLLFYIFRRVNSEETEFSETGYRTNTTF